MGATTEAN